MKRVNVDIHAWMVESLDKKAKRLGVTRQSIIKIGWLKGWKKLLKPKDKRKDAKSTMF